MAFVDDTIEKPNKCGKMKMQPIFKWVSRIFLISLSAILVGCATLPRNPVPPDLMPLAEIPGLPDVRAHAGELSHAMEQDLLLSLQQESAEQFPVDAKGHITYPYVALSGGGANGAFGAGFMGGWTESGKRPVFKIVTGVSTGALMAPFVFIGPETDGVLRYFYTNIRNNDVFSLGSKVMALLRRESMADTRPLASLIEQTVDESLLKRIADAHQKGRRLYIGTVDLDSRRFVIWNMGRIAEQGNEQSLELFRKVMLASSSIPIAFPPVLFKVEAKGKSYDEMHVDGFIGANVFLNVGAIDLSSIYQVQWRGKAHEEIYIIHNGQLNPEGSPTHRSIKGIASRSLEASARAGILGDLFREYAFAQRNNAGFNWITVEQGTKLPAASDFDPEKMSALYQLGFETAMKGPIWKTAPPGVKSSVDAP